MMIDGSAILLCSFFLFFITYFINLMVRYSFRYRMPIDARSLKFTTIAFGLVFVVFATYSIMTAFISRGL
jgi:hypothetical protein